ncbi:hydantoinase B/oxoprolinase family protein [Capillimicrobium parvum]|uniref:Acetophenone carboxylase delta subunit n=1 Tax=Capillimicrobium parvum TaxID=2884022 RepID=A0A9E6XY39_9ACTN|nr:hydantoinase B/oxoprolinase family protein [Capillimicrobium parvum]UGS35947.1 Acetophenone carboxylase delta subunit [Capillimicrobium parvum]
MTAPAQRQTLDPVTFEVLKNAFSTIVDQMAEQILRTCHSFVIYSRDFSSALCDPQGNTIMQGSQDIAVHVGTLHLTARAVVDAFDHEMRPGDVFAINDPYVGGTHFNDVRIVRPIFHEGELICLAESNGHWADIGGSVPGSFDITAREHFGEGVRVPPVRIYDEGVYRRDIVRMIVSNTRAPDDAEGDCLAQVEATAVAEREILRLCGKYGRDTIVTAMEEVQDYVERLTRKRISELPDGTWETEDYIDSDPDADEGLVPIRVRMTIDGDVVRYDLSESHPAVGSFLNSGFGASFSGVVAGTKTFFPDVPLNSGFYRALDVNLGPPGSCVNAAWPTAVTGFCAGPYEKIMSSIFELWSEVIPERAMAAAFNLEYLLVGGRDARSGSGSVFMWYDWMAGGWGGRNGKDGSNATSPVFGVGLAVQPLEAQERLCPVVTLNHAILPDTGGPGRFRGGCGVEKGGRLTDVHSTVMSYCCDRARSVTWGIGGGLPSFPHGVWMNPGTDDERFLGAVFSNVRVGPGDSFTRPSAGGGGFGDPLERDPEAVCEDVADGYVTVERAARDYGVAIRPVDPEMARYEVDAEGTRREREHIRAERRGWLQEDPEEVAARYRAGEVDVMDVVRRHGVILHWGTGELLPRTTEQFRAMLERRTVRHWDRR